MALIYQQVDYTDPQYLFNLVAHEFGTIFLDSNMLHEHYGRYSYIVIRPICLYSATSTSNIHNEIQNWQKLFSENSQSNNPELPPFTGGLVGYFSYDLSKQLEYISNATNRIVPDYYLGLYNQIFAFDLYAKTCYILVNKINGFDLDYASQFANLQTIYTKARAQNLIHDSLLHDNSTPPKSLLPQITLTSNIRKDEYIDMVNQAINYITAGDIFEINIAQCFSATIDNNYPSVRLYNHLRQINQAPFSAYLNFGQLTIMSASPERFISINDRHVEARPIKGTIKRGTTTNEDMQLAMKLRLSEKDNAENIMIVDLMRNDLSKICTPESVTVSQLCGVESFTNIHHLVSVIHGKLKDNASIFDIIPACFPGGSITGAPKIRAMQIIEELESTWRGVYCGSIGYFGFNGNVDLSIAIRTIIKNDNDLRFYVGGAITLDSNAIDEYDETILKGQKLSEVFT